MVAVLVFALTLTAAVLLSERAHRTVLSAAVLFLLVGLATGPGALGLLPATPDGAAVREMARVALFAVLFNDGLRVDVRSLARAWRLPGRALILGMPIAFATTAALARFMLGMPWPVSLLVSAALVPTDPVFASAIMGREEIPDRLRHLLNVESGVNDGLTLPALMILLAIAADVPPHGLQLGAEVLLGIALGLAIPLLVVRIARLSAFGVREEYVPLGVLSIGLLLVSVSSVLHANEFLAAFTGGAVLGTSSGRAREAFAEFGGLLTEILKLAAVLLFGALISPSFLANTGLVTWAFALLTLLAVRPISLLIALAGSGLSRRELAAAAWFGPKGFASVVYGLLILVSGVPGSVEAFHAIAIVVSLSIVAHSSTDVLVARWFRGA